MTTHTTITHTLCEFVATARDRALPPAVELATRRAFINWLGCALGGADDVSVRAVLNVARLVGGSGQASVVGTPERLDVASAALANGVSGNALDFDDMHVGTLIHPTGPVVPAALALAEHTRADGNTLCRAIAAGIEIECRLGLALFPRHYDAGWHSTATLGTLGAVSAAAVVLALDTLQIKHAFGIAATQASGLRAMLPNACKSFNVGHAASAGVLAALLAQAGLESATDVLEGKHGLFAVFGQPESSGALLSGLGQRYAVTDTSLKPYPCGVVIHPAIDAAITLSKRIEHTNIAQITACVHPRALDLADRRHPDTAITARFSLQHATALAFIKGAAGYTEFETTDVNDPRLRSLRDRIELHPDQSLSSGQARLVVTIKDGGRAEAFIDAPSGSPAHPLSDDALKHKFMSLATLTMPQDDARRLFALCERMSALDDCNRFAECWAACSPTITR